MWRLIFRSIDNGLNWLISALGWIGAACATIIVGLIGTDIIGRRFFNNPTGISEEVSAYLLVAVTFLGVAYTFAKKSHLSVNIILDQLSARWAKIMSIFNGIVGFGVCAVATWYSLQLPLASIRIGSHTPTMLRTPLVYPQMLVPIGMGVLALAILAHTIKVIATPAASVRDLVKENPPEYYD